MDLCGFGTMNELYNSHNANNIQKNGENKYV